MLPSNFLRWPLVSHRTRRWIGGGCCAGRVRNWRGLPRWAKRCASATPVAILDRGTLRRIPEPGTRAGGDGHTWRKGSKAYSAGDTPGDLLALRVTPADAHGRDRAVAALVAAVQEATGDAVTVASVDGGPTGERPVGEVAAPGVRLEVVKPEGAKRDFVVLPWHWVVERSFAWAARLTTAQRFLLRSR